jgi:hypothetical protein
MRAAKFVSILTLVLSFIALQGACDVDDQGRAFELCDASTEWDSETTPLACVMAIPEPPEGEIFDPTKVNITLELDGMSMNLSRVDSESDCSASGGWGWYYSPNNLAPEAIVLCPSTCDAVRKAEKGKINVELGCPTVVSEP